MPALKHLVDTGSSGNLASLDPPISPIMWTSIATGMTAEKHGVLDFTQPRADGKGVQPALASSRKVKALWNILMQSGRMAIYKRFLGIISDWQQVEIR